MGYWNMIGDGVKRIMPESSSVKHAGGKIYRFTSAAFTKIDQMLGDDGSETRTQIGVFTTTLAQNAARYAVYEGFKLIPGVNMVTEVVSKTMNDMKQKKSNHPTNEAKQEEAGTSEEKTEQENLRKSKKSQSKKMKPRARL